MFFEEASNSII